MTTTKTLKIHFSTFSFYFSSAVVALHHQGVSKSESILFIHFLFCASKFKMTFLTKIGLRVSVSPQCQFWQMSVFLWFFGQEKKVGKYLPRSMLSLPKDISCFVMLSSSSAELPEFPTKMAGRPGGTVKTTRGIICFFSLIDTQPGKHLHNYFSC